MLRIFTAHAGEYLVGNFIERHYPELKVWLPSKDTGVDLLATDAAMRRSISLQVRLSKDFRPDMAAIFLEKMRACGWFKLDREKTRNSSADYWVLVLAGFSLKDIDYVLIKPEELLRRLEAPRAGNQRVVQSYIWTSENACWETRGLSKKDQIAIANGYFRDRNRRLARYLNNWTPIKRLRPR